MDNQVAVVTLERPVAVVSGGFGSDRLDVRRIATHSISAAALACHGQMTTDK